MKRKRKMSIRDVMKYDMYDKDIILPRGSGGEHPVILIKVSENKKIVGYIVSVARYIESTVFDYFFKNKSGAIKFYNMVSKNKKYFDTYAPNKSR